MKKNKNEKCPALQVDVGYSTDSLKVRCARLRDDAEAGNDDASAVFFTALYQALSLRIPESLKEANLILLLDRKLADIE